MDNEEFRDIIARKDQYKILAKKLSILKQAMRDERQLKKKCIQEKEQKLDQHQKLLGQINWKTNQNDRLTQEIKELKEEILDQRNIKRKLRQSNMSHLKGLSSPIQSEKSSKY